jgi:predicted Ser/Thr protein kinase
VTTRIVPAPVAAAVAAVGSPAAAVDKDSSKTHENNVNNDDGDDDDDDGDDSEEDSNEQYKEEVERKLPRGRPQLARTERSKAIAIPNGGVAEGVSASPGPSPVPPRKVSERPEAVAATAPPVTTTPSPVAPVPVAVNSGAAESHVSPRRSQVLLTAAEAAGPKPEIDERGLVPVEALPNMTQEEMLQWTQERLVSKANPLDLYDIDESRRLGKGGFGAVYYGTDKKSGAPVAVKKMQINKRNKMKYLLIETELHAKSSAHPNIVAFIESFHLVEKEEFWVVLEFIDGVTLEALLDLPPFGERQMAHVTREVCKALVYIHAKQRLHRDIKLGNVLIGPKGMVKLTDFGLAAQLTTQREQRHTLVGTPDLLAPEVIAGIKYGTEVDVWALGMLVIKMCRASPLLNMEPRAVLDKLQRFGAPRLEKRKYSAVMKNFIECAVQMKPSDRQTSAQLLQHEWLTKASSDNFDKMLQMLRTTGDAGGGCSIQ